MKKVEQQAKAKALAHVNKDRAAAGLPPLKRHSKLWWSMFGREWIAKIPCPKCGDRRCETKSEECGK